MTTTSYPRVSPVNPEFARIHLSFSTALSVIVEDGAATVAMATSKGQDQATVALKPLKEFLQNALRVVEDAITASEYDLVEAISVRDSDEDLWVSLDGGETFLCVGGPDARPEDLSPRELANFRAAQNGYRLLDLVTAYGVSLVPAPVTLKAEKE